ncbi:hypothetical protein KMW28_21800 [Flammeovirga yaeyamensis]|uniref:Uncharacterized protein n=1 Tax=Flammeovirga yaeyamensis TaxID=367791 RepID=A0AAX1NDL9_9BACT|nr:MULTISPECIES: hypothetical protein [Flammeovirga]ANQ52798.1 hypothetical protein MY04_5467 [Flammeovirga sp. MY04]MBB3697010.1 hypothetical protein [Flammeovirga yaeyamensis]NMF33673.1 hypothetical protein [Flammeovirga yaeyamensis]QWG05061.1 hypothetical protein KMW28_21800 [Flammeovirga yaeyamensis]
MKNIILFICVLFATSFYANASSIEILERETKIVKGEPTTTVVVVKKKRRVKRRAVRKRVRARQIRRNRL